MNNSIRILVVEPNKKAYLQDVPNELKNLQVVVGGYLESVTIDSRLVLFCNEDGLSLGLPKNRAVNIDRQKSVIPLVGTYFFVAHDGNGELVSLSDDDVKRCKAMIALHM